ncbi:PhnD/SsuA/transferrin family substrate-binding protein, partial [Escherichia coli]|nr:PhnD/SsuA/transferrin family substrate-binding protein [Escherichia coli]
TDYDRNRNAMIAAGRIKPDGTKVIWTSEPLPNDAFAVPKSAPREFAQKLQAVLTSLTTEQAKEVMPPRYTGFVSATHATYKMIEDAGIAVGRIKAKS